MYFHVTGTIDDPSVLPPLIESEKEMSKSLQDAGFTLCAFRRAERPGVLMVVEAENITEATRILQTLPFVAAGAMTVDLAEVLPA